MILIMSYFWFDRNIKLWYDTFNGSGVVVNYKEKIVENYQTVEKRNSFEKVIISCAGSNYLNGFSKRMLCRG